MVVMEYFIIKSKSSI